MNVNFKTVVQEILEGSAGLEAELMSRHTTFRIGELSRFLSGTGKCVGLQENHSCLWKKMLYFILGNEQSSCKRQGLSGVVVQLYVKLWTESELKTARIHAQAGALLSGIASCKASLTGFEFAGNSGNLKRRC